MWANFTDHRLDVRVYEFLMDGQDAEVRCLCHRNYLKITRWNQGIYTQSQFGEMEYRAVTAVKLALNPSLAA